MNKKQEFNKLRRRKNLQNTFLMVDGSRWIKSLKKTNKIKYFDKRKIKGAL